ERTPTGYESKWFIPTTEAIDLPDITLPVDPYTVGCILGDGSIDKTSKGLGEDVKAFIGTENVYGKRIPQELLWAGNSQRLAVLQGLMDTDGTVSKNNSYFCTVSDGLANDVLWLARSLGFEAKLDDVSGPYNLVHIYADVCPFLLPRKVAKWVANKKGRVAIKGITSIDTVESQCIAVADPTHSFLAGSFVVTHNTTLLGEYLFLYIAVFGAIPGFGEVELALYISDSIENGVKNMRKNLEYRWQESVFLQEYVPRIKFTDVRWEFFNKDGSSFIVMGYGAQTGVRGTKAKGKRPTLAILDDLISDDDARSKTVIASIEATVGRAIKYALHPSKRKIIWSGTPFNSNDPLYKAVESGAWYVNVYPVCNEFPCTKEEFHGSWEDRFTYESILEQYQEAVLEGKLSDFNQELMLRIISDEDRLVLDTDIVYYPLNKVIANKGAFNFYITTDFATSESMAADYSVIEVWALNNNGDWLLCDGICRRQTMDKNMADLFRFAQKYRPQQVGVEVSGQQGGYIQWIQNEMMDKNIYFTLASENNNGKPGVRPNKQKLERFNTVLPWFKTNKIWLPQELKDNGHELVTEMLEELRFLSPSGFKSKHDDACDGISMLSVLTPWRPSEETYHDETGMWEDDSDKQENQMASYVV
nr:hypothetical protein [Thiomicrorhabdus sp.]